MNIFFQTAFKQGTAYSFRMVLVETAKCSSLLHKECILLILLYILLITFIRSGQVSLRGLKGQFLSYILYVKDVRCVYFTCDSAE